MASWMIDASEMHPARNGYRSSAPWSYWPSYCLDEPGSGPTPPAPHPRGARRRPLCAQRPEAVISGAGKGDIYVVMVEPAATPGGISTLVIEGDTPGLRSAPTSGKDGLEAQPTRRDFRDARVPVANRLGDEGIGFRLRWRARRRTHHIAACRSAARNPALDKSLAYMRERKAFGKRLDEFQGCNFRLADMATELEAARDLCVARGGGARPQDADATMLCAMAKRFGTDVGFEVANQALQLHGGYGYLSEYGIEKIVRDLRVHQILEGTNEIMRLIVARKLIEGAR